MSSMNRRSWLKASSLLASGLPLVSSLPVLAGIKDAQSNHAERRFTEAEYAQFMPPELKARLFANENPFGPSEKAKKAIAESLALCYQYPFMTTGLLEDSIITQEQLGKNMVMLGAGSSPLLLAAAMYFSRNGANVIAGEPSYDDLPSRFPAYGGKWKKIPLDSEYKLDLSAMENAIDDQTSLIYVCNPNNPTGTIVDNDKLRSFCERVSDKVTVLVDEAYIDYLTDPAASSMIDLVRKGKNIILARTFSKLHGFAGLRVGYFIGQPKMLREIDKYSTGDICISASSASAALASYQDSDFLASALAKTTASREFLYSLLKEEGYDYIPSSANFVMFPLKMESMRFSQEMMKRGVGIRSWKFDKKDWCRVSLGRMDEMQAFASAFKELS